MYISRGQYFRPSIIDCMRLPVLNLGLAVSLEANYRFPTVFECKPRRIFWQTQKQQPSHHLCKNVYLGSWPKEGFHDFMLYRDIMHGFWKRITYIFGCFWSSVELALRRKRCGLTRQRLVPSPGALNDREVGGGQSKTTWMGRSVCKRYSKVTNSLSKLQPV